MKQIISAISKPANKTLTQQIKVQHLLWRAGFGPSIQDIRQYQDSPISHIVQDLLERSRQHKPITALDGFRNASKKSLGDIFKELKRQLRRDLNVAWFNKLVNDKAQLRERMTLFWHGHFACRDVNAFFMQQQNNTIRKHALGNFGDLLRAIAKDPAMLKFLNNRENRKQAPNENFARELLELFTLGIGNYTEKDIKNAARAFTGWNFNKEGQFKVNEFQHDKGAKTFMGQTGNFDGDDIINIVLKNKQTALFICGKVYRYFVNSEEVNQRQITELADVFYNSNYNITQLLQHLFTADWFYAPQNIGNKIKSPIDLMVSLIRTFNIQFEDKEGVLHTQRILGQELFRPPSVAGWKGGRNWIDSSTLTFRMSLPNIIFNNAENIALAKVELATNGGGGGGESMGMGKAPGNMKRKLKAQFDIEAFHQHFIKYSNDELVLKTAEYLLQTNPHKIDKKVLNTYIKGNNKYEILNSAALVFLSLPEYQLC